jgi:hypothetical protein
LKPIFRRQDEFNCEKVTTARSEVLLRVMLLDKLVQWVPGFLDQIKKTGMDEIKSFLRIGMHFYFNRT